MQNFCQPRWVTDSNNVNTKHTKQTINVQCLIHLCILGLYNIDSGTPKYSLALNDQLDIHIDLDSTAVLVINELPVSSTFKSINIKCI